MSENCALNSNFQSAVSIKESISQTRSVDVSKEKKAQESKKNLDSIKASLQNLADPGSASVKLPNVHSTLLAKDRNSATEKTPNSSLIETEP